jgi:DNA-3-methyladenine glycosylase
VGEAVLIRACEPVRGLEKMKKHRMNKKTRRKPALHNLTSGPGKLCQAMGITTAYNKSSLISGILRMYDYTFITDKNIMSARRIGVDYAAEAKEFLYRFYIRDNKFVST